MNEVVVVEKVCSRCKLPKPITDFAKSKNRPDGHQYWCKLCKKNQDSQYYQSNKEKFSERMRIYWQENKKTCQDRSKKWREDNPERFRELVSRWNENNPERVKQISARHGGWTPYRAAYRISSRYRRPDLVDERVDRWILWLRDEGICQIRLRCEGAFVPFEEMHMDHVIPISKGGRHSYRNTQVSCSPCNLAKGGKIL
jgi:hypothetical protein